MREVVSSYTSHINHLKRGDAYDEDNLRRDHVIHNALRQWYPGKLRGNRARHLTTLAALISGIVASKSTQLPKIATQVPDGNKPESRVKRYSRWVVNERISERMKNVYGNEAMI